MVYNYDPSQVGNPYTRVSRLIIAWPDNNGIPEAVIEQVLAVKLIDGTVREIAKLPSLIVPLNLASHGEDKFPLINPADGTHLGVDTDLNTVFVQVLAAVRVNQIAQNVEE